MRVIRPTLALVALCLSLPQARATPLQSAVNTIQGAVTSKDGVNRVPAQRADPLADAVLLLQDEIGSLVAVTAADVTGRYSFAGLTAGTYRVVAVDPPGSAGGDAVPGPGAVKIDANTLQLTIVPGVTLYANNNFVKTLSQAPARRIDRLLTIGDSIKGPFSFSSIEPLDLDPGDSIIRRSTEDGSLFVLDTGGAALLRFRAGRSALLLDTSRRDPLDGVALTRLLRVETSRDGVSAILALRADNTRGIYRLDQDGLTRVTLLPGAAGPAELAVSDGGQVAYVAPVAAAPSSPLALFQTVRGRAVELLRQGQGIGGAAVEEISDLTANDAGDLSVLVTLRRPDQTFAGWAVVRKTSAGVEVVAATGQVVEQGRGAGVTGPLTELDRPRIGPDGAVVFMGTGPFLILSFPEFVNFYVGRPGRPLQPLLRRDLWNWLPDTSDYDIAADSTIALRATLITSPQSDLYLAAPAGDVIAVAVGRQDVKPVGRPAFGPGGLLFFQAKNPTWPFDRNGRIPAGLFRFRPGDTGPPVAVAVPGQAVPGKPGTLLLGVPQRPVVSAREVAFAGLFGGSDRFPVPTAGLFRVPLGGTLADGVLVGVEGVELPAAALVVALQDFYYTTDGTLVFDTFARRELVLGQLIAIVRPGATTASAVRTQAVEAAPPVPLLAKGDDLGSGRKLQRVLGRLIALGTDRYLFAAEFTQPVGAGEGLFIIDQNRRVQAVAMKGDPALGLGLSGARFVGFGETPGGSDAARYAAYPPAVSGGENVVFKARLERSGGTAAGLFQWSTGGAATAIALSDAALVSGDPLPYDLQRWAAGVSGRAYFLEQHQTRPDLSAARLFERSAAGLTPLVVPGQTRVLGDTPSILTELTDFAINRAGELFVHGATARGSSVLAVRPTGLVTVASQGQPVPPTADGRKLLGLFFEGSFTLVPESAGGDLFFRATVWKPGAAGSRRGGIFRRTAAGGVETVLVEGLSVGGARDLTFTIAKTPARPRDRPFSTLAIAQSGQVGNGTIAFAARSSDGRWAIYRSRLVVNPTTGAATLSMVLIAQEGQQLPDGPRFASLDPSLLLGRPIDSGPVFTMNAAGDVAFLASDGQRWSIYRFTDRP